MLAARRPFAARWPRLAGIGVGVLLAAAACSTLPDSWLPPFHDHELDTEFVVPADGRFVAPVSSDEVVVHELRLSPQPTGEHFEGQQRFFTYAPGTRVAVRGRLRIYARADAAPRGLEQVFPKPERRADEAP
jgi:hypothetical protein